MDPLAGHRGLTEPNMEISGNEQKVLNFYRVTALHGGRILAGLVPRAREPRFLVNLTRHAADLLVHTHVWSETILAVGGQLRHIPETYQYRFQEIAGPPPTFLHFIVATQVIQRRVYRHFLDHLRRPGTHRRVQATLYRMIEDERHHLAWIKEWLDERAAAGGVPIEPILDRYAEVDAKVYTELLREHGWGKGASRFAAGDPSGVVETRG